MRRRQPDRVVVVVVVVATNHLRTTNLPRKSVGPSSSLLGSFARPARAEPLSTSHWTGGSVARTPNWEDTWVAWVAKGPPRRRVHFMRGRKCRTPIRLPLALPIMRLMERSGFHRPGVRRSTSRPGLWRSRSGRAQRTCGPPRHGENRSICDWNIGVTIYR